MAYELFENIDDFKKYAGGAVNINFSLAELEPSLYMTAQLDLVPVLGQDLYDSLRDAVANGNPNEATQKLLEFACRPLALLSLFRYIDIGTVQMSGSGMTRTETEERKTAFKYQEANYRDRMQNDGFEALELLQQFVDQNSANYSAWSDVAKRKARGQVINYATQMREVYSMSVSRYTFEMLRALIPDLELFALVPVLGQDQYDELKEAILTGGDLETRIAKLLLICQRVIAHFTVEEAMRRNWVQLEGSQVVQRLRRSMDGKEQIIPATLNLDRGVGLKIQQAQEFAERWTSQLCTFLDKNIADYPLYASYKTANEEVEESADDDRQIDERSNYTISRYQTRNGMRRL